jgi:glutathione S-transferase
MAAAAARLALEDRPPRVGDMLPAIELSQLRGLARHTPDIIEAKGRADIDALAGFLADKPFLLRQQPSTADAAVFGLLAPMVYWPMQTPVAAQAHLIVTGTLLNVTDPRRAVIR